MEARVPGLRGERTELRHVTTDDLELLAGWFSDPAVYPWWGGAPLPREVVERKYIGHRRPTVESYVVLREGSPIGYLQYAWLDDGSVGLDMFLVASARDQGLGPDAARAVIRHLIDDLGVRRITVDPLVANPRAVRAWMKAGFVYERDSDVHPDGPALLLSIDAVRSCGAD